jgi:hypothetical protein
MNYQEHSLLTSQEDAVFDVVREAGFDPNEFEWSSKVGDTYNGMVPCLIHKPTRSIFTFDFDRQYNQHCAEWSPGEQQPTEKTTAGEGWPFMLHVLSIWLENVERERSSPNLWARLAGQRELFAGGTTGRPENNSRFNIEEQAQVAEQLDEIRELLVQTYQLDGEQLKAIEAGLGDLRESSTRMGRREWLIMVVGTIATWALAGLVPPGGAQEVLTLALRGLGDLFGGGLPQLPRA